MLFRSPGLAFGTGTHPTTRMCLRWTAQHAQPWSRVLDYGCGSGILAIGAALHGAASIDAVDIDPAAVESTQYNAQANGVTLRAGLPELAQGVAGALARASAHPLAQSLAQRLPAAEVSDLREVPGFGVEGIWQGQVVRLGRGLS